MTDNKLRILFTSAGRRVELMQCFRRAAGALGVDLDVMACDLNASLSAACQMADHAFDVPRCTEPDYAAAVLDIVRAHGIQLIIPTIDSEIMPLAVASGSFAAEGARVHVSAPPVVDIARDKMKTAEVLSVAGVSVPMTVELEKIAGTLPAMSWPMFLKPRMGSASRGLRVISSVQDLPHETSEPMLLQELLQGPEFTINMFVSQSGELTSAVMHRRLQVRAGEVEKGRTERREDLRQLARQIVSALPGARGILCFQVIDDVRAGPKVLEINARFGGGYPLADHAGAHYAKWLMEEVLGIASTAHDNWREGVTMLRYDSAVFRG